jgi:PAS domain S-box-containing protein
MPLLDLTNLTERDRNAVTRARLAALVDSSADAIVVTTLDGTITDWNPAAERLFGYTGQEAIGQVLGIITPPAHAHEPGQFLARLRDGESIEGVETMRRTKDGRLVDVSLTLSPIRIDTGQIIAASGILRDITERKAAEHAVAAAHQRTRQVLESTSDGFLLLDRDWRILDFNPAAESMFGTTRDEVDGTRICQAAVSDVSAPLYAALTEAMAERHPTSAEGYYAPVDRWFEVRAYPAPDGLAVFFRDITDGKRTADALQESEARFRAAFENASIGMVLTAPDERTLQVNQALCDMLGYSESELLSLSFATITHPDHDYLSHADLVRLLNGEPTYELEKRYVRKDGRHIWVRLSGSLIRDETGAPRYYLSLIQDITERKQAEADLRHALETARTSVETTRQFLAVMGHVLRTPMQVILGYTHLVRNWPKGSLSPDQVEDIHGIERGVRQLSSVVSQVLDLAHLESGQQPLALEPMRLAPIIAKVRRDAVSQAAAKGLTLRIDLSRKLPLVFGDEKGVYQILLSLVGNAVKFTAEGEIRITAQPSHDEVVVAVRDTGIGIAAEDLPHVFAAFHPVNRSLTRQHDGAGLGLAIASRVAERMGGSLAVESKPGAGSTFTLRLRIAEQEARRRYRPRPAMGS